MHDLLVAYDKQLLLWLNSSHSAFFDAFFFTETSLVAWLPFILVFIFFVWKRQNNWHSIVVFILMVSLTILLSDQISSGIIKPLVQRLRPSRTPEIMDMVHIVNGYRGGRYGFVSSHAANSFAIATLLTCVFRQKLLALTLYIWSLLFAFSRIYLGVHYPGDILGGFCVALFVVAVVFALYQMLVRRYSDWSILKLSSRDVFIVSISFLVNVVSILVYSWLV